MEVLQTIMQVLLLVYISAQCGHTVWAHKNLDTDTERFFAFLFSLIMVGGWLYLAGSFDTFLPSIGGE